MDIFESYYKKLEKQSLTEAFNIHDIDFIDNTFNEYGAPIELGRDIVYDFVSDEESAEDLYGKMMTDYHLEELEPLALEGLINDALTGANEHEAAMEYMDHIKWSYVYRLSKSEQKLIEDVYKSLTNDNDKLEVLFRCLNNMSLEGLVTESL